MRRSGESRYRALARQGGAVSEAREMRDDAPRRLQESESAAVAAIVKAADEQFKADEAAASEEGAEAEEAKAVDAEEKVGFFFSPLTA